MVLLLEQATLLQRVMASKSCSADRETRGSNSPTEYPDTEESPARPFAAEVEYYAAPFQVYFTPTSSATIFAITYPYAMYAAMPTDEYYQVDTYGCLSAHQDMLFDDTYTSQHAVPIAPPDEDSQATAVAAESCEQNRETFDATHNFMNATHNVLKLQRNTCQRLCLAHSDQYDSWTFQFPAELCGRLIGKRGRNMRKIMQETKTNFTIFEEEGNEATRMLRICGTESQILEAVSRIEHLFLQNPIENEFKDVRLLPVVYSTEPVNFVRQVELPSDKEGTVKISSVIHAGHFFLVMTKLARASFKDKFEKDLDAFYNSGHIPKLQFAPPVGTYCVGNVDDKWFRMQIISCFVKARKVEVLLLDYGYFITIPSSSLRKMRLVFLKLPKE